MGGSRYTPIIRLIARIVLTVGILLAVAAMVFFRQYSLFYLRNLTAGDMLMLWAYGVILLIYAVTIAELHVYWYSKGIKGNPFLWLLAYIVLAAIVIVLVNTLFIQVLVIEKVPNILEDPTYWRNDFPFFALPLLAYIVLQHIFPGIRVLLRRKKDSVDMEKSTQLELWEMRREPGFLLSYLRLHHGKPTVQVHPNIRFMDIIAVLYEQGSYFLLLWNGEKLLTDLTPKDIAGWPQAGWIVRIGRNCYFNMLYVKVRDIAKDDVRLNATAKALLSVHDVDKIESAWHVTRKCRVHIQDFMESYKLWSVEGWERSVELSANENI